MSWSLLSVNSVLPLFTGLAPPLHFLVISVMRVTQGAPHFHMEKEIKVAVWDTYVKKQNGDVLHFDIIVPEDQTDEKMIYSYGKKHLALAGEATSPLSIKECRFCHVEEPTVEMYKAINEDGYYILELENIPAHLPHNASRRDIILHLRAHFEEFRFADFKGKSEEEVRAMLQAATHPAGEGSQP